METKKVRQNPYQALIEAYEQELLTIDASACPNVHSQIRMGNLVFSNNFIRKIMQKSEDFAKE